MVDGSAGIMEQVHLPSSLAFSPDLSLSALRSFMISHTKLPIITRNQKKTGLQGKQRFQLYLPSPSPQLTN